MNTAQTDLQQLRIKHIHFKSKIRSALFGGTYDPAFFSTTSPVNQWFTQVGVVKYNQEAEIKDLVLIQTELNSAAKYLIELYKNDKIDQAHEGLSKIDSLSEKFIELVSKLENRLDK